MRNVKAPQAKSKEFIYYEIYSISSEWKNGICDFLVKTCTLVSILLYSQIYNCWLTNLLVKAAFGE
jgi:hypothetical protein